MDNYRLTQQIQFIVEIDKLKKILRQTMLTDASRRENSAEHSWHLAMMTMILAEYAPLGVDLFHAMKMVLIHDLVEIDAGDTFCFDVQNNKNKAERETAAAKRLFGILPENQRQELHLLWEEFEARETPSAKFATALDRIQPMLNNKATKGGTWQLHNIKHEQVMKRMAPVEEGAPQLWDLVQETIKECIAAGYLQASTTTETIQASTTTETI